MLERGVCIDPAGPNCPEYSSPTRDGCCVGDKEPDCEQGYKHVEGLCRYKGHMSCEGDGVLNGDNCETKEIPICEDGTPKGRRVLKTLCAIAATPSSTACVARQARLPVRRPTGNSRKILAAAGICAVPKAPYTMVWVVDPKRAGMTNARLEAKRMVRGVSANLDL